LRQAASKVQSSAEIVSIHGASAEKNAATSVVEEDIGSRRRASTK